MNPGAGNAWVIISWSLGEAGSDSSSSLHYKGDVVTDPPAKYRSTARIITLPASRIIIL